MSKPKSTRIKAASVQLTRAEAEDLLLNIGSAQRQVTEIEGRMNDEIAAIKARYERQAAPHNATIEANFRDLQLWAAANRDTLCTGSIKTVKLATGLIQWRKRPASVRITKVDAVIERLKALSLRKFIRTKEEIDKEAMLAAPEEVRGITGIKIVDDVEDFVAKPYESEIERADLAMKVAA